MHCANTQFDFNFYQIPKFIFKMAILSKSVVRACAVACVAVMCAQPVIAVDTIPVRDQDLSLDAWTDLEAWKAAALAELPEKHPKWEVMVEAIGFGPNRKERKNREIDQIIQDIEEKFHAEEARRADEVKIAKKRVEAANTIRNRHLTNKARTEFLAKREAAKVAAEEEARKIPGHEQAQAAASSGAWFLPTIIGCAVVFVGAAAALCLRKPADEQKSAGSVQDSDSESDNEDELIDCEAGETDGLATAATFDGPK